MRREAAGSFGLCGCDLSFFVDWGLVQTCLIIGSLLYAEVAAPGMPKTSLAATL
jgi:hypothetical protein